jgi:HAD superfamily hydrolase (TIGR01549 family)
LSRAALLDLDGTLVDSNYQHTLAWYRAFRRHEIVVPVWRIHRHIGMGGDQLVEATTDQHVERRLGDRLREAAAEEFRPLRDECVPLAGAKELVVELKQRELVVVMASSAGEDDLRFFLDRIGVKDIVDAWTTDADVKRTKPYPDVIHAALEKAGTDDAVMIGDSRWDIEAASTTGHPTIAVVTGGWSKDELRQYGAIAVYESLAALRQDLDTTPLAAR